MENDVKAESARRASFGRFMGQREAVVSALSSVGKKIAVYSAKGGVGKTTVAVNLAAALAKSGVRTGLFDADIDCPNAAQLLGCASMALTDGKSIRPAEARGVKLLSMDAVEGRQEKARPWRGPMLSNAIVQLLSSADWGELDYLVVDMPPGTSDSPLTVMQLVPIDGFVIVTSPQKLAVQDAFRSASMCRQLGQKMLGVVENMSGGAFGDGGGSELAARLGIPLLASIPLNPTISEMGDRGVPAVEDQTLSEFFKPLVEMLKGLP